MQPFTPTPDVVQPFTPTPDVAAEPPAAPNVSASPCPPNVPVALPDAEAPVTHAAPGPRTLAEESDDEVLIV